MSDLCHLTLIGRIGHPPEARQVGDQTVCDFTVAVNESKRKADDTWTETPSWFKVVCWGVLAQRVMGSGDRAGYQKGLQVAVSGRVRIDEWTGRDGKQGTTVVVTADSIQRLREPRGETAGAAPAAAAGAAPAQQRVVRSPAPAQPASAQPPLDDEPPF